MTLYVSESGSCPRCHILEEKMKSKNMQYDIETNPGILLEKGYLSVPVLETDEGELLTYLPAVQYVNSIDVII